MQVRTLAGGLRKSGVVTQIVAQTKVGHTIYTAIAGEQQAQSVTSTEGGQEVRRVSTGTAICDLC